MSLINPTLESLQEDFIEPWVGFDLDGSMADDSEPFDFLRIGAPIWPVIERMKQYMAKGIKVKVFTARMSHKDKEKVAAFVKVLDVYNMNLFGKTLEVTCVKDMACTHFYDDKARQLIANTGIVVGE